MAKKQKLELTWVGKETNPKLEPRILVENPELSYHAKNRMSDNDIFDNMLIHGDNLLALKALEQEYTGKIKCIYIDPPFNTGDAMEHYDDGVEHSIWLGLMYERLKILHRLLADEGTIFVHIDDNEIGYLITILDELFGRSNKLYIVCFKQGSATGHKAINPGCVSTTNFILMYAKDKSKWTPNRLFTARERDTRYNQFITNIDEEYQNWKFSTLMDAFAQSQGLPLKEARKLAKKSPELVDEFVMNNPRSVVRLARPDYKAVSAEARDMIDKSNADPDTVLLLKREKYSDMYFVKGERILFYTNKLKEIDGEYISGEPLTTLWDDLLSNNLHNEGGIRFPKGKKPEALLKRVIELSTNPGDIVLDSFAGSGTTSAVAHKMGRKWITVELGEHCYTHVYPRLEKIISGDDDSGVTKATKWKGGGGFRFYELGPSLISEDRWGNPVINPEFNPAMLAEAMCKLEGFTYEPSDEYYWMHGSSTETDFIYVTTQFLGRETLTKISDDVGPDRSLLVCCTAFKCNPDDFENLTIKKIPKAVLKKCEWGHDDYSLAVENLPEAPPEPEPQFQEVKATPAKKFGKDKTQSRPSLFDFSDGGSK